MYGRGNNFASNKLMEIQRFPQLKVREVGFVAKLEDELVQCLHTVELNHAHFTSVFISMCCSQTF